VYDITSSNISIPNLVNHSLMSPFSSEESTDYLSGETYNTLKRNYTLFEDKLIEEPLQISIENHLYLNAPTTLEGT